MGHFWQAPLGGNGDTPDFDPVDSSDNSTTMHSPPDQASADSDELAEEGTPERRCQRAVIDIRSDEVRRGQRWPVAERRLLIEQRIRELEDLDRWVEASIELHRVQLEVDFRDRDVAAERHRELIETVERGNVVAKVVDLAKAHPFLAGLIGAGILGHFRSERPRK